MFSWRKRVETKGGMFLMVVIGMAFGTFFAYKAMHEVDYIKQAIWAGMMGGSSIAVARMIVYKSRYKRALKKKK